MKISKLLSFILGLSGFLSFRAVDGDGGGMLDMGGAAGVFETLLGEEQDTGAEETPEAAAERLAAEEANAEQDVPENGEQDPDQPEAPDTVTIEVDGKPVQMTKAELAEAVKGQMRQADYTQKTMVTAEEKKAAQAEKQAAAAEREKLANQLQTYSVQQQGALANIEAQLTDELLQSDPLRYLELERIHKKGQADLAKASADLTAMQQQYQAEQAERQKEFQQSQHQALLDKLPTWKDPAKAKEEVGKISKHMQSHGFTDAEIGNLYDHRIVLAMRKAMLYDDLMERATKAPARVAAAPAKVERPGVAAQQPHGNEARVQAMKRLEKGGGKVADAAAAFASIM